MTKPDSTPVSEHYATLEQLRMLYDLAQARAEITRLRGLYEERYKDWLANVAATRTALEAKHKVEQERDALAIQVETANKRFADILDQVDGGGDRMREIEKIAVRAMLECQGHPLTSTK